MRRFIAASLFFGAMALARASPPGAEAGSAIPAAVEGSQLVTLIGFDASTLVLTAVDADGQTLSIQYTADTEPLAADLGAYEPPDPCLGQATAWNHQIGSGFTRAVIERLSHFAKFSCDARVQLGEGNVVLSFEPVPFPPNPI